MDSKIRISQKWNAKSKVNVRTSRETDEKWNNTPTENKKYNMVIKSNPGLPHCKQILYHLGHQESPDLPGQNQFT